MRARAGRRCGGRPSAQRRPSFSSSTAPLAPRPRPPPVAGGASAPAAASFRRFVCVPVLYKTLAASARRTQLRREPRTAQHGRYGCSWPLPRLQCPRLDLAVPHPLLLLRPCHLISSFPCSSQAGIARGPEWYSDVRCLGDTWLVQAYESSFQLHVSLLQVWMSSRIKKAQRMSTVSRLRPQTWLATAHRSSLGTALYTSMELRSSLPCRAAAFATLPLTATELILSSYSFGALGLSLMSTIACAQRFKTNICRHTWMASNTTAKGMVKFCNQWSNGPLLLRQQMISMSYKKIIATCYPAAISVRGYGGLHMKGQISGAQGDADKDQLNTTIDDYEEERELCSLCWA